MGQLWGSGVGNWKNAAIVEDTGRLWTTSSGTSTQLYDDVTGPAVIDNVTFAQATIEYEHYNIHLGSNYTAGSEMDVANAGSIRFLLQTPNTSSFAHVFIHTETEAEASRTFYENVTVSASGEELAVYNRNRTSPNLAGMKVFFQPTISSTGSCLQHVHWGTAKKAGAEQRSDNEWVLKSGTGYGIVLQNETSSANIINNWINWYEHKNNG